MVVDYCMVEIEPKSSLEQPGLLTSETSSQHPHTRQPPPPLFLTGRHIGFQGSAKGLKTGKEMSKAWWLTLMIPVQRRLRQNHKFQASLAYRVRSYLKIQK